MGSFTSHQRSVKYKSNLDLIIKSASNDSLACFSCWKYKLKSRQFKNQCQKINVRMSEDPQLLRQFIIFFAFGNYFLTYFYEECCYVNAFPEQRIHRLTATCNNRGATLASQLIPPAAQPATSNNRILPQQCNTTPSSPQPEDYFESFSYSGSFHRSFQLYNCCKCP